jgi:hypothetical protein
MSYTIIILIIYAAAHIIAAMAKKAAERKERERLRIEMERRRGHVGLPAPSAEQPAHGSTDPIWGQPGGPANPLPPTVRSGRPIDDLAARRKQQLEQLRIRREAGRAGAGHASVRTGSPPTQRSRVPQADFELSAQAEEQRRQREQAEARRIQHAQETQRRENEKRARRERARQEQSRREQARQAQAPAQLHRPTPVATQPQTSRTQGAYAQGPRSANIPATRALQARMRAPGALRELFIIKELLDPPVSLRSENLM